MIIEDNVIIIIMVKEIWKSRSGMCKENSVSRQRLVAKSWNLPDAMGLYYCEASEKIPYIRSKFIPPNIITGISTGKKKTCLHINIDQDVNGKFRENQMAPGYPYAEKDFKCSAPIPWTEDTTKCSGSILKTEDLSKKVLPKKMKRLNLNFHDTKCKQDCLDNGECSAYTLNNNNICKQFAENKEGYKKQKTPLCKVKPYIYNYTNIDKKYRTDLEESGQKLDDLKAEASKTKANLINIYDEYSIGADKYNKKRLNNNKIDFDTTKGLGNKYFDTLLNFHKDDIDTIRRDNVTIKTTDNVYITDHKRLSKNKTKLSDLSTHLETVNRQGGIIYQTLLKHNGIELLFKILTSYFIIIIILLILKNRNIIKDTQIVSYIVFALTTIVAAFIFFRFLNSKNRSLYNYQNKVFKVAKK